jgi:protein phosphatase
MPWCGIGVTDRGRVRKSNQDAFAILNERGLWVVADGMGGRAGGDVASRLGVDTLVREFSNVPDSSRAMRGDRFAALRRTIRSSNDAIRAEAIKRPELIGMGTTLVLVMIPRETSEATVAHVGDSRAYLVRQQALIRLTRDHSFIEDALRHGRLSKEQAVAHPLRHVLTRALGAESDVDPDISVHNLHPDDVLLLCTDGLTKMLSDDQILALLLQRPTSPDRMCAALIEEANRQGGDDNVSVVIVRNELTN